MGRVVLGSREAAPHPEQADPSHQSRRKAIYAQCPTQADFFEHGVEHEWEQEPSNATSGQDDATSEASAFGEPFGKELDDGEKEEAAANPDPDALREEEVPHLFGCPSVRYSRCVEASFRRTWVAKLEAKRETK